MIIRRANTDNFLAEQDSSRQISVINKRTHQVVLSSFTNIELTSEQIQMYADFAEKLTEKGVFRSKKDG